MFGDVIRRRELRGRSTGTGSVPGGQKGVYQVDPESVGPSRSTSSGVPVPEPVFEVHGCLPVLPVSSTVRKGPCGTGTQEETVPCLSLAVVAEVGLPLETEGPRVGFPLQDVTVDPGATDSFVSPTESVPPPGVYRSLVTG